ncbi:hypothetical protein [Streptomyces prunicolor]|uniref:hypothetical protein n=1 Tax=Streptomyces prunicolor TaxID=67348 RepID=UPI003436505D
MNRATHVPADWDHRIGRSPARLQDRKQAETIAALYAENAARREQISSRSATVVPLTLRR